MKSCSNGEVDTQACAQSLTDSYWIPKNTDPQNAGNLLAKVFESVSKDEYSPLELAFKVFSENVQAVQLFLTFPYSLAKGVLNEASVPGHKDGDTDFRLKLVTKIMIEPTIAEQLHRMKQQAVILLWSAYETYSRDVFVALLNEQPGLYNKIIKSPLKEKFSSSQIFSFSGLQKYDFTLGGKLGIAMADGKDFSSPSLLRSLFTLILPKGKYTEQLSIALESQNLWRLGHRRHLVAHRSGVVDENYLSQTGDGGQVAGTPLVVHGREIDEAISELAKTALLIFLSATEDDKDQNLSIEEASLARPSEP